MELAKSTVLHESALEAIEQIKRNERHNDYKPLTALDKKRYAYQINEIREGKPFYGESTVHYLSRRCWELTEAIYAMQKDNENQAMPNFSIEIERLKSHLETARTLLGKPDIRVTVNNHITFALVLVA